MKHKYRLSLSHSRQFLHPLYQAFCLRLVRL